MKLERDGLPLSCSQNKARSLKPTVTKTKRWNHELLGNVVAGATVGGVTGAVMEELNRLMGKPAVNKRDEREELCGSEELE